MAELESPLSWRSALRLPGLVGTLAFVFYLGWNIRWLARGAIPPSILIGIFGIPAPTTGMTRSTFAFLRGDWRDAFLWNPFTLPFYGVLLWTTVELVLRLAKHQRPTLSKPLVIAWPVMLLAAWITKFAMGSDWW